MSIALIYGLLSVGLVSVASLVGAFALGIREGVLRKGVFILVSVATGALFGDALFHLIPESIEVLGETAMLYAAFGVIAFFILEKIFHWHHHHAGLHAEHPELAECPPDIHTHSKGHLARLIIASDSLHNFLDGLIIGASYLVSLELGIATTLAVLLHELPQEIGDFGVLVHAGLSKARALLWNFSSALFAFAGLAVSFLIPSSESLTPFLIAFAAGNFLYLAGSDLVPELQKTKEARVSFVQLACVMLGFAAMYLLLFLEGR